MIVYARSLYFWDTLFWRLISGLPALTGLIIREFFNALAQPASTYTSPWWLLGLLLKVLLGRISTLLGMPFNLGMSLNPSHDKILIVPAMNAPKKISIPI